MINLTKAEFERVTADWDPNVYRSRAAYFRARLCDRAIKITTWDRSLDGAYAVLAGHGEGLRKIGVNLNQLAKHFNTTKAAARPGEVARLARWLQKCQSEIAASRRELAAIAEHYTRS